MEKNPNRMQKCYKENVTQHKMRGKRFSVNQKRAFSVGWDTNRNANQENYG